MYVVRLKSILRFGLFVIIALSLIWYVSAKRADFYRQTAGAAGDGPVVPALAPATPTAVPGRSAPDVGTPAVDSRDIPSVLLQKDFFAEYRLDRDRARAREIETLRDLTANSALGEAGRKDAGSRLMRLTERGSQEVQAEALLKAKGFDDAVVILRDGSAEVIIRTSEELTRPQLAIIADVVTRNTGLKASKVSISARH